MKTNKLITHNGPFHADDIFACAALSLMLEKNNEEFEIIRTRNSEIIEAGDFVFDVGGIYNEEKNLFDHHQTNFKEKRENNIPYSSFGLIWKKFGEKICGDQETADSIDKKLVAPIDAGDNGFNLIENKHEVSPYFLQDIFSIMLPTWREEDSDADKIFLNCVEIAKMILSREIIHNQERFLTEGLIVSIYKNTQDKRIIVLDKRYPYEQTVNNFPETMFVIYPRKITGDWGARAIRKNLKTFENRKDFPKSWAGLRDEELQKISGVAGAVFCHRGLFLAVAKSKEGAIQLAQKALAS